MKKEVLDRGNENRIIIKITFLVLGILLLSFMDFIMLEKVYKPLSEKYSIPWDAFEIYINIFGAKIVLMWWHVAFFVLAFFLFISLGIAIKDWRVSVSGIILFMTGWEDIGYYLIQGKFLPEALDWLSSNILVSWPRFLLNSSIVTSLTVIISAFVSLAIVILLFNYKKFRKLFNKK